MINILLLIYIHDSSHSYRKKTPIYFNFFCQERDQQGMTNKTLFIVLFTTTWQYAYSLIPLM